MEEDFRIIELFKKDAPSAFETADKAAQKAMSECLSNVPRGKLENFIFWTMVNFYTYQVVQEIIRQNAKGEMK